MFKLFLDSVKCFCAAQIHKTNAWNLKMFVSTPPRKKNQTLIFHFRIVQPSFLRVSLQLAFFVGNAFQYALKFWNIFWGAELCSRWKLFAMQLSRVFFSIHLRKTS